jgi:hypothetical protein
MVHQQDLADAKAEEVAAQQGLAEAQLRVAGASQERADGIQNGLLIKVLTALVEEALNNNSDQRQKAGKRGNLHRKARAKAGATNNQGSSQARAHLKGEHAGGTVPSE